MDAVADPAFAGALARLGGLAVLNLEGVQTRYDDPASLLERIATAPDDEVQAVLAEAYKAPIREELDKTPIGHLTAPEVTKQGVEMVALCSRTPTTVDTPLRKSIRDKMFAEKFEAKSKAYLAQIRKAAMIEYPK